MSKVIKVSDIVYSEKGLEMVEYAGKLSNKCSRISTMIGKINNDVILLDEEQFSFLGDIVPANINHSYHKNYDDIYNNLFEFCLKQVSEYLVNELKSINKDLETIVLELVSPTYNFNTFRNDITQYRNDIFAIYSNIEKYNNNNRICSLCMYIQNLAKAFEFLHYIYNINCTNKRHILGEQYVFLLSKIRTFFYDLINDMEIEFY